METVFSWREMPSTGRASQRRQHTMLTALISGHGIRATYRACPAQENLNMAFS